MRSVLLILVVVLISCAYGAVFPPRPKAQSAHATYMFHSTVTNLNFTKWIGNNTVAGPIGAEQDVDQGCGSIRFDWKDTGCGLGLFGKPFCIHPHMKFDYGANLKSGTCKQQWVADVSLIKRPICGDEVEGALKCGAWRSWLHNVGYIEEVWSQVWDGLKDADKNPFCKVVQSGGPIVAGNHKTVRYSFSCNAFGSSASGSVIALDGAYPIYDWNMSWNSATGEPGQRQVGVLNATMTSYELGANPNICTLPAAPSNCIVADQEKLSLASAVPAVVSRLYETEPTEQRDPQRQEVSLIALATSISNILRDAQVV